MRVGLIREHGSGPFRAPALRTAADTAALVGPLLARAPGDHLRLRPVPLLIQVYDSGRGWSALAEGSLGGAFCGIALGHVAVAWRAQARPAPTAGPNWPSFRWSSIRAWWRLC